MDALTARRHNVTQLVADAGGPTAFGRQVNREQAQVSQWISERTPKPIGNRLARYLESSLGLDAGWLDTDQTNVSAPTTAHKVELNTQIIAVVARSLRKVYAQSSRVYSLEDEPERFASLYRIAVDALATGDVVAPDNMVKLLLLQDAQQYKGSIYQERNTDRQRDTRSVGVPDRRKDQGTAGNRGTKS